jgi:hypothetical protein
VAEPHFWLRPPPDTLGPLRPTCLHAFATLVGEVVLEATTEGSEHREIFTLTPANARALGAELLHCADEADEAGHPTTEGDRDGTH